MKLVPIIAALALTHPVAAQAQSVSNTHELVWYPAGKTPSSTYRPRDKATCATKRDDHRAGKGQPWSHKACPAVAEKPTPAPAVE